MKHALMEPESVFDRRISGIRIVSDGRADRAWLPGTALGHRRTFQDISGLARGAACIFLTRLILQVTNRILVRTTHDGFWIFEGMKLSFSISDFQLDERAVPTAEPAP